MEDAGTATDSLNWIRAFFSLLLVLGLIGGLSIILRRYGSHLGVTTNVKREEKKHAPKIQLYPLPDHRYRLLKLEWHEEEHLLIMGPQQSQLIASHAIGENSTDTPPEKKPDD